MAGPLSHIRVLDMSRVVAGPWAGQMLADLGADVIKVERPGTGDDTRSWGPPFLKDEAGKPTDAGYFLAVNRGKRSLTLDLASPEGQHIIRALAARSDVLLENYKVGTLTRFGLGYQDLKAINPRLVYCSITGFGQSGPKANNVAYDFMIQASGGLMSVTGERDDRPGGGPQKVGVAIIDLMTGMYASSAVLAALVRRNETGEGEYIDLAMLDVSVAILANHNMNYLISGQVPQRTGNRHANIQPQDVFACRDGHISLVVGNDGQFARFCEAAGLPELARDPRFVGNEARVRNQNDLLPAIADRLRQRDVREWVEVLSAAGVPCGPINRLPEVFADPQVKHRGIKIELPHPAAGSVPQVANPIHYAQAQLSYHRPPPTLGQHTIAILQELGFSREEVDALKARGVV
jgi:crotonobetainyl-CoA:carnitine CoA-transferase CaiB-like acyl-CoA transferase